MTPLTACIRCSSHTLNSVAHKSRAWPVKTRLEKPRHPCGAGRCLRLWPRRSGFGPGATDRTSQGPKDMPLAVCIGILKHTLWLIATKADTSRAHRPSAEYSSSHAPGVHQCPASSHGACQVESSLEGPRRVLRLRAPRRATGCALQHAALVAPPRAGRLALDSPQCGSPCCA